MGPELGRGDEGARFTEKIIDLAGLLIAHGRQE
jgi:hypothetical protein